MTLLPLKIFNNIRRAIMNYHVYNIENTNARIFKKGHYQFDYIESDSFEKLQNSNDLAVIGCIKLKEIEKEDAIDTVVISSGITDHYFKLMPPDKMRHLNRKHLIGYVMVGLLLYLDGYVTFSINLSFSIFLSLLADISILAASSCLTFPAIDNTLKNLSSFGYQCLICSFIYFTSSLIRILSI